MWTRYAARKGTAVAAGKLRRTERDEEDTFVPFRFRNVFLTGLTVTAVAIGCSSNPNDGSTPNDRSIPNGAPANDAPVDEAGTTTVEASRASALVTGRLGESISGDASFFVDDEPRTVVVAPDRTFVVREVPSGTTTLFVEANGLRGSLTLENVRPGDVFEVEARVEAQSLVVVIVQHDVAVVPPREVTLLGGAPLEIYANAVCYFMRPGIYERDVVIYGNDVRLFGAGGCGGIDRTILRGALTVRGQNAFIQDIELAGPVLVEANQVRVQDSCSRCFADACYSGRGGHRGWYSGWRPVRDREHWGGGYGRGGYGGVGHGGGGRDDGHGGQGSGERDGDRGGQSGGGRDRDHGGQSGGGNVGNVGGGGDQGSHRGRPGGQDTGGGGHDDGGGIRPGGQDTGGGSPDESADKPRGRNPDKGNHPGGENRSRKGAGGGDHDDGDDERGRPEAAGEKHEDRDDKGGRPEAGGENHDGGGENPGADQAADNEGDGRGKGKGKGKGGRGPSGKDGE